jgi:hypothetical protein
VKISVHLGVQKRARWRRASRRWSEKLRNLDDFFRCSDEIDFLPQAPDEIEDFVVETGPHFRKVRFTLYFSLLLRIAHAENGSHATACTTTLGILSPFSRLSRLRVRTRPSFAIG